jgi:hypothetical protein
MRFRARSVLTVDGRRFDDLLRYLTDSRRSLLGGSLAAIGGLLGISAADAKKKKKKPCKKKCQDGCCTNKYGKCIKPAQQTPTQCGTGGAICWPSWTRQALRGRSAPKSSSTGAAGRTTTLAGPPR